jgi:hypothetical protein
MWLTRKGPVIPSRSPARSGTPPNPASQAGTSDPPVLTQLPPAACAPARFSGMAPASGCNAAAFHSSSRGDPTFMPRPCPHWSAALRYNGDAAGAAAGPVPSWAPRPAAACGSDGGASGDANCRSGDRHWSH